MVENSNKSAEKYTFGIIHRYMGSSKADWYEGLRTLLEADGHKVIVPDLPGDEAPKAAEWLPLLEKEFDHPNNFVLIGHSIGSRGALLFMEEYRVKVELLLLVGALSNETSNAMAADGRFADFFTHKINPEVINDLADKIVLVHSTDDSSVSFSKHGQSLASELGAELITYQDKGHFRGPEYAEDIYGVIKRELSI